MTKLTKGEAAAAPGISARISSIDFLRGLVIILMALDHVRDYVSDVRFDPLDLEQTNLALFLTRWITHFCAPAFIFLAGTSIGFQRQGGKPDGDLSMFLLTRGLWLMFLEVTIVGFAWMFNPLMTFGFHFLQVIWVIGLSMVLMAAIVRLPLGLIAALGALLVVGHNLLAPIDASVAERLQPGNGLPMASNVVDAIWLLLHMRGGFASGPFTQIVAYPLIPWLGVMMLGFVFAEAYRMGDKKRWALLTKTGLGAIAAFLILRGLNIYGDPDPWVAQANVANSLLSFIDTEKYPPSLLFLLMTLGPAILLLAFAEKWRGKMYDAIVTFGRVPLFFYVAHLFVAHLLAVPIALAQGNSVGSVMTFFIFFPPNHGVGLFGVYLFWALMVVGLYWPCKWFAGVKKRNKSRWLSYL